jgi:catechol 2,3-dioxygenase-like lactoylglutathione lyase family enzyme
MQSAGRSTGPITGIDHVVVLVQDLDQAAERYRKLGFALTPRGTHSPHMGTGNYCIMFQTDYMELLGILQPTENNATWRERLGQGEGLKSVALASEDAAAAQAHFQACGYAATAPLEFGRPVDTPQGSRDAKFKVVRVPENAVPAFAVFVCQHFTRELVWLPAYQRHPNTVTGIANVVVATPNPAATSAPYARIFASEPKMDQWGDITVDAGKGRAVRFISPDRARVIYDGAVAPQGETYVAALELWVEGTGRAAGVLAQNSVLHDRPADGRVRVRAEHAAGVVLDLVEMKR